MRRCYFCESELHPLITEPETFDWRRAITLRNGSLAHQHCYESALDRCNKTVVREAHRVMARALAEYRKNNKTFELEDVVFSDKEKAHLRTIAVLDVKNEARDRGLSVMPEKPAEARS